MTENVIYSYDPDEHPSIRYHAIPSSCAGGASTLGEARASYRADLTGLLHVGRRELPSVIEHLEGVVAGTWVRTRMGAVHRERASDRMFLQTLLSRGPGQDKLRADLDAATRRGAAPIVLIVEPDEPLGSVLDQMTPGEALWVTYPDDDDVVGWITLYGSDAGGAADIAPTVDAEEFRDLPITTFAEAHPSAVRVYPPAQLRAG
jgi:hypothetical protein